MAAKCSLVAGDQRRVGLGGEVVGKVKRAGSQGVHVISSDLRFATLDRNLVAHEGCGNLLYMKMRHPPSVRCALHTSVVRFRRPWSSFARRRGRSIRRARRG